MTIQLKNQRKLLLIMRISAYQMLIAFVFVSMANAGIGMAQKALKNKYSLNIENQSMAQTLSELERIANVHFMYSTETFENNNNKVSAKFKNTQLATILHKLFDPLNIDFEVEGDDIVLIRKHNKSKSTSIESQIADESFAKITISGKITDEKGEPAIGVSISVKGTTIGTSSDVDGKFTIEVPDQNSVIVFSIIGYLPQEFVVGNQVNFDIKMKEDVKVLEDVVVVGYGTQKKQDVTGSLSSIKAEDLRTQGSNTIQKSLQGRAAGVQVESAGGDPGSGVNILIRGTGSLTNNTPLYIVDGVQVDNINNLNPTDIASMEILKDASAAAIYGSRAGNGVVLVTTKSGKKGDIKVDFNAYLGVATIGKKLDLLNASQWATMSNAANDAAGLPHLDIAQNPQSLGVGTDWQKQLYRTAPVSNYVISAGGGGDNYNFNVSAGYLKQNGIVKQTDYERFNLRLKSEFTKGRVRVGESIILSKENTTPLSQFYLQSNGAGNAVESAARMIPAFQVNDPGAIGGYGGAYGNVVNIVNPLAQVNLDRPKNTTNSVIANVFAELTIVDGLKYKYNTGYTYTQTNLQEFADRYQIGSSTAAPGGIYQYSSDVTKALATRMQTNYILQEHTLNYAKTFGKHGINALAGFTYQNTQFENIYGGKQGMPDGVKVLDAGTSNAYIGSNSKEYALLSYLGRLVYSYDNRYVLTGTFRRDGSSRFGTGNKYGVFPSIAAAWNVSNEKFFEPLANKVSNLKLRASYGLLGNQNIPDYLYSPVITTGLNYVTGQNPQILPGASQTAFATPSIRWEKSSTYNFGMDLGLFQNKLNVTADYFIKKNTDVLLQVPLPLSSGASSSSPYVNVGEITNKGLELALTYNNKAGDFKYQLMATFTKVQNQVDKLGTGDQQIFGGQPTQGGNFSTVTQAGHPIGEFYLIKSEGIFQSQAEIDAYRGSNAALIQPNAKPGDIKFEDYNHDGQIDQKDRQYVGNPNPNFTFGFGGNASWKNFDISVFFQGTQGNKIYNGFRQDLEGMRISNNFSSAILGAWTPTNTNTDVPRAITTDPNFNDQTSTRFLEDGSYLRFKTLQLGYTLPESLMSKIKISRCRFYVSFDNLFTITSYKGYNPDLGRSAPLLYAGQSGTNVNANNSGVLDRGVDFAHVAYPLSRTAVLGVQVSF